MNFAPGAPETNICPTVNRIHTAAEKVCSSAGDDISGISITVEGSDFYCGGRVVHGCTLPPSDIYVHDESVLRDEIGHLIWYSCFHRSGEEELPDGGAIYDPDFEAWVHSLSE